MVRLLFICVLVTLSVHTCGTGRIQQDTMIYLFPGQGSDYRIFKHLNIPEGYDTMHISYPVPARREDMRSYSHRFIELIQTDAPYILLGVSMGGMICTELSDTLRPLKTIIISSAKGTGELPARYTFQQKLPINRMVPAGLTKTGARILQGIVEPDRRHDRHTFISMLRRKEAAYLKRTVDMIINWERSCYPEGIIHIHGNKDHTIPVKNVQYDYLVPGGSHMMMITRASEINEIMHAILHLQQP